MRAVLHERQDPTTDMPQPLSTFAEHRSPASPAAEVGREDDRSLLDHLPRAVVLLDGVGQVLYLNTAAELYLQRPQAQAVGRNFFRDLAPHLEEEGVGTRFRSALQREGAELSHATTLPTPNAPARPVTLGLRTFAQHGEVRGMLAIDDRSALVVEQERRRQAERLASVGDLATGVAHEINNPLAAIRGFAQLLAREPISPEQQQALEIISQESTRIAQIVNNLLDYAREQLRNGREMVSLSEVVDKVVALKRYALETAGVAIGLDLDPSLSPVCVEPHALQRIILGLISHAERTLNQSGSDRRLRIRTRESTDGIALYVVDNGPGIPREQLPTLLDDPTPEDEAELLGLRNIAAMIREQDGQIWADSVPGQGTAFTVRFRRAPQPVAAAPVPVAVEEEKRPRSLRILVADDESTLRLALALFLGRHGHSVMQASNAYEALRLAEEHEFDVALIDVRMPGDGLTLLRTLDRMPHLNGRTILMAGDVTSERIRTDLESGRPYLNKPFEMTEVLRLLEELGRPAAVR